MSQPNTQLHNESQCFLNDMNIEAWGGLLGHSLEVSVHGVLGFRAEGRSENKIDDGQLG